MIIDCVQLQWSGVGTDTKKQIGGIICKVTKLRSWVVGRQIGSFEKNRSILIPYMNSTITHEI